MIDKKVNIVVTDDHKLFRKGMIALLEEFDQVGELYESGNGIELLDLIDRLETKPDLVLLDLNMPEMDGVEATKRLRKDYPEIRILILSMEDGPQMVSYLITEGVNGYLLKNADPDELEIAIRKVMRNDFYFSGSLSELLIGNLNTMGKVEETVEKFELSDRELQVLRLICEEKTAAEIADIMSASPRTIEGIRKRLLTKVGARNMAGLVIFAVKNKLIEL